jgi:ketosteroid isomerase-like protein
VSLRRFLLPGLLACGFCLTLPVPARAAEPADAAALRRLNADYLRAFLACDVARFRDLLADDFYGVLADGKVIDKTEFLREAAQPPGVKDFRYAEITVRLYGDAALVNDLASYRRSNGTVGQTRYVDVWARRPGGWQVVSVQITRVAGAVAAPAGP